MEGKEIWKRVFNTDFEEAVLSRFNLEKDFEDMGTEEEHKEIVEALDGLELAEIMDIYLDYNGYGISASDIASMIDMLQIEDIETIKEWGR